MTKKQLTLTLLAATLAGSAWAAGGEKDLGGYMVDMGPGPVAAHEILGLPGSAVTTLQSPKDLLVALNAADTGNGGKGFGLAVTPARSGFKPMAVGIADYSRPGNTLTRLWGGTTFSYANGKKDYGGTDYDRYALAVHVHYYLKADDDPSIAARKAFIDCAKSAKLSAEFNKAVLEQFNAAAAEAATRGRELTGAEIEALEESVRNGALYTQLRSAGTAAVACVRKGFNDAKQKWNASQVSFTIGQGWLKGEAGGLPRTSLGRHVSLALAMAPREMENSLFNLTLRHVTRAVDTTTLTGTLRYDSASLAAVRYTYGWGEGQETYLLAEASNVKPGRWIEADAAFKYALGLDHKIGEGMWLELRMARSRPAAGSGLENKALFSLKISPQATLPKLLGG